MNYLSIDTEYTSFYSPERYKSGELLQLAIRPIINGVKQDPFNEFMRPLTNVWSDQAERVHKISRAQALEFQHPKEAAEKLRVFMAKYDHMFTVIGHNPQGDKKYLERFVRDHKMANEWHIKTRPEWKCTASIAAKKKSFVVVKKYTLESLCQYFKIPITAHDALSDADSTWTLYEHINAMVTASGKTMSDMQHLTEVEKRQKYRDIKYVMFNGEGSIYISEYTTKDREALRIVLDEIWNTYGEV